MAVQRTHPGFTPHFNPAAEQLGHTKILGSGALIFDGLPYSPGIPTALRETARPKIFATRNDRAEAAAHYEQRGPYRLKAVGGGRQDSGSLKLTCPASTMTKHAVRCGNKPASMPGRLDRIEIGTALPTMTMAPRPAVCEKSTVTVSFDDTPFWQPHVPFTAQHQWSINRRNQVESAYSRIKDEATQSVRRGTFRVFGRVKITFAVVLASMAASLLEVARWQARLSTATMDTHGRGRPKTAVKSTPRRLALRREAEKRRIELWRANEYEEGSEETQRPGLIALPAPPG